MQFKCKTSGNMYENVFLAPDHVKAGCSKLSPVHSENQMLVDPDGDLLK